MFSANAMKTLSLKMGMLLLSIYRIKGELKGVYSVT